MIGRAACFLRVCLALLGLAGSAHAQSVPSAEPPATSVAPDATPAPANAPPIETAVPGTAAPAERAAPDLAPSVQYQAAPAEPSAAPAAAGPSLSTQPSPALLPAPEPAAEEPAIVLRPKARVMTGFEVEREHPSAAQGVDDATDYGMFLDQARVGLEVEIDKLELDVSADFADAIRPATNAAAYDRPPYIRNAHLSLRLHKAFRVRAGRFKRPFSGLELTSSGDLPIRGRGLANGLIVEDAQWGDRALGLMLYGRLPGKLRWHVAGMSPAWTYDGDLEPQGIDALARLEWEASDGIELGLSGGHKLEVRAGEQYDTNAINVDARMQLGKLELMIDAMLAQLGHLASPTTDAPTAYGLVVYGAYRVPVKGDLALEPVLSFEYADADSEFSGTEAVRVVAGLNLLLTDHLRVMPQVELTRSLEEASAVSPWSNAETYYLMFVAQL
jgi:hypothetical protein